LKSLLPLIPLGLAGFLACRGGSPSISLPLRVDEPISSSVGGVNRKGVWIWPGERLRWTIPAGPAVSARLVFRLPLEWLGGGEQKLVARVSSGGSAPSVAGSVALGAVPSFRGGRWREEKVAIPATRTPRALEVSLEGDLRDARPVFFAESVLEWPRSGPPSHRKLIVLFLIDTLRADHLSLYGYGRPTTPEIDRTFASALVADHCFANANWTLPSHVSLMTSTTVNRHGVRARDGRIPSNFPLLAESLAAGGYSTLAVTGGGFVDGRYGFSRGFDQYASSSDPIEVQVEEALRMIDEAPSASIFLFFHTYQVHDYAPSETSARQLFGSTGPLGDGWRLPIAEQLSKLTDWGAKGQAAVNRYDAALRRTDAALGAFVAALRKRGLWQDTAMIVTSDHGEQLFDRASRAKTALTYWGHGQPTLYEGELAVPLLVRAPVPFGKGHLATGISLLDVAPTILDIAGIAPPATFEGRSIRASRGAAERPLFSEAPPYDAVAVHRGLQKVIVRPGYRQHTVDGKYLLDALPDRECFALDADRGERDGERCATPWAAELLSDEDRYVATSFPDSVVLRLHREARGPCVVIARGRPSAPSIRTFAAGPTDRIETGGDVARAKTTVAAGDVWFAFRPTGSDRGLSIDLVGCGEVRTAAGTPVAAGTPGGWSDFLWRARGALPSGNVLMTVPPMLEPIGSARLAATPELLARLRALGYLTGGPAAPAAPRPLSAPLRIERSIPVSPGRISVQVR